LILNVLASVSQWERETIVERTVTSLRHMKDQLQTYNHPPLGYQDSNGRLIEIDEEQRVVAEVLEMRHAGQTFRAIADDLNYRGIVGKRGGQYYASTIRAICNNTIHQAA
jgi:site-specific DNA recombinase